MGLACQAFLETSTHGRGFEGAATNNLGQNSGGRGEAIHDVMSHTGFGR
jgi:hypothetical protein